jgi:hypothetical protein
MTHASYEVMHPSVARNDTKVYYFFFMLFLEEERDEELRLEDRLTLEEELFELREEDTLDEEPELLLDDTDLEGEREETEEELLVELRLTADLGAGDFDLLALVELTLLLPPLWREEGDGEELEILFLVEGVSDLDLEDFLKEEEIDGKEPEYRLFLESLSLFSLEG